ncbi:unnamed protein product, partial [Effrenium voratum]
GAVGDQRVFCDPVGDTKSGGQFDHPPWLRILRSPPLPPHCLLHRPAFTTARNFQ